MDPLAQAMQLLQEAMQTIQMLAEEVQVLKEQSQSKADDKGKDKAMTKTSSVNELSMVFGLPASQIPEFAKTASFEEAKDFYTKIESNIRYNSFGKVASFEDGVSFDNPNDALESSLSSILSK